MKRKHAKTLLTAAMLGALVLAPLGCNTNPIAAKPDAVMQYPEISISQESLRDALGFQQPIVTRVDNDLMRVTLPVRARSNEDLQVEYRVIWFDEAGIPLRPEMSWTPMRLEPRQPTALTVNATSSSAKKYNIQWRWGRK